MFTSLILHEDVDEAAAQAQAQQAPSGNLGSEVSTRWRFEARPPGFEQVMYDRIRAPNGAEVEHFVFSDRLSAYSIYIEPDASEGLDGTTRIGAVHAAGRQIDGHQVTVVGEVPAAAVEAAAAGVRPSVGEPR
jgi:sigma-E factor negative regulatory protein RseB